MDKLAALGRVKLFAGLPAEQLRALADIAQTRKLRAGEEIFASGGPGTHFYALAEGRVRIYRAAASGKEQVLHVFGPGDVFAEVPVFEGKTYPASGQALTDGTALGFARTAFLDAVRRDPELALGMMALLSARLRGFVSQIAQLSLKEVPERLAGYLLLLRGRQDGDAVLLDLPKSQIAAFLGTIPETLSRALKKLSDQGLIAVSGGRVRLLDPVGLARLAEDAER